MLYKSLENLTSQKFLLKTSLLHVTMQQLVLETRQSTA